MDPQATGTASSAPRYAPPTAEVADVAAGGIELGGRGLRLLGAVIDGALLFGLLWLAGMAFSVSLFDAEAMGAGALAMLKAQLLGIALFLALNAWLLARRGQTVGKLLLGLRIVRSDGSPANAGRVIGLRYFLSWTLSVIPMVGVFYSLVDALMIFRGDRRCLHDLIADTIVVKI